VWVYVEYREEGRRREPRKPPFKFLVPLIYAPVLPLSMYSHIFKAFSYFSQLLHMKGTWLISMFCENRFSDISSSSNLQS
jgi:hypothetical protein